MENRTNLDFDRDSLSCLSVGGYMYLSERGDSDWSFLKVGEHFFERGLGFLLQ